MNDDEEKLNLASADLQMLAQVYDDEDGEKKTAVTMPAAAHPISMSADRRQRQE